MKDMWSTMKRSKLQIVVVEEEVHTKDIANLLNAVIAENFPDFKKESCRCRKLTE
jgi:hypothetical protein